MKPYIQQYSVSVCTRLQACGNRSMITTSTFVRAVLLTITYIHVGVGFWVREGQQLLLQPTWRNVSTLHRSFYPTRSEVHPVSILIHPVLLIEKYYGVIRDTAQIMWSDSVRQILSHYLIIRWKCFVFFPGVSFIFRVILVRGTRTAVPIYTSCDHGLHCSHELMWEHEWWK